MISMHPIGATDNQRKPDIPIPYRDLDVNI